MVYKCKICAGSVTIQPNSRIAVCDYCGVKQVLPLFNDDSTKILYDRGNEYLLHNEYDKAENVFTQLLSVCPNDGEIFWDLVLCKYGVTYAKDPATGKYIPTCNRTYFDSIFKDPNYLKAIEYSTLEDAEVYKHDAALIDNIQKGIIAVSRKEKPYDIFISYKETDANGNRTQDSINAQKIYDLLTEKGYKVFFSRITLESKVGEEYEPYIYAALSSSKLMITVCSSRENIESAWVKNEWSRFLTIRRGDSSKTLIPVFYDMEKDNLPEEFAILPAQDMANADFEQELLRGISKIIPSGQNSKKSGMPKAAFAGIIVAFLAIIVSIVVILNKGDDEAEVVSSISQGNNVVSSVSISKMEEVTTSQEDVIPDEREERYNQALELISAKQYEDAIVIFTELGDYQDSQALIEKCAVMPTYDAAMELYLDKKYPEAAWAFSAIADFEDAAKLKAKAETKWRDNVAVVAFSGDIEETCYGGYFVTANGTVDSFSDSPGGAHVEILPNSAAGSRKLELNEHGKIVSIEGGFSALYALYEDGHVTNSAILNGMESDWENIIQITSIFGTSSLALRNDGKVLVGDIYNLDNADFSPADPDTWLLETTDWENVVKLDYGYCRYGYGGLEAAMVVGLSSSGTVNMTYYDSNEGTFMASEDWNSVRNFVNSLENIVDIEVGYFVGAYIAAMDSDNTLHIYRGGVVETQKLADVVDFAIDDYCSKLVILDERGNMSVLGGDAVLSDVVRIDKYAITQSGSIYDYTGKSKDSKTLVKDAWLEGK